CRVRSGRGSESLSKRESWQGRQGVVSNPRETNRTRLLFGQPATKHLAPEKHQDPNMKRSVRRIWSLEFGASLELGAWSLVLLPEGRLLSPHYDRLALPEDCANQLPMLRFSKMNGAGNDFVMIDNRVGDLQLGPDQIAKICDRHRGVGADGVLVLERATNGADFRMRYYNADGGEAEMCGNGARCFARYADRVAGPKDKVSFETPAGVIGAELQGELVRLEM